MVSPQLKKAGAENQTEGTKGSSSQEENCFHVNSLFNFDTNIVPAQTVSLFYITAISNKLPSGYLQDIFQPPQA